jgi:hypothetical protein
MRIAPALFLIALSLPPAVHAAEAGAPAAATPAAADAQPSVRFLSPVDARTALTGAAGREYYARLQLAEMRAKTGLALRNVTLEAAREQVREFYGAEVLEFTAQEQTVLRETVIGLHPTLLAKAPLYARTPWSFIKVSAKIEGGLPHTRGDHIILSDGVLMNIVQWRSRNPTAAPLGLWNLLAHEQTHILQRHHAELFAALYESYGFRHVLLQSTPLWLLERNIVNPDAPDTDWVFPIGAGAARHWILPDLVLKNIDRPRMPDDFDVVALDVEEHAGAWSFVDRSMPATFQELGSLPDYTRAFPTGDELFHPNEISAGLLATILSGSRVRNPEHELWGKTRAWAEQALR